MSEKKLLVITPPQMAVSSIPAKRSVLMKFDLGQLQQFLDRDLGIEMSPTEARKIAQALNKMARAAEGKPPLKSRSR